MRGESDKTIMGQGKTGISGLEKKPADYLWDEEGHIIDPVEVEDDSDAPIADDPRPRIEPGDYTAECFKTETKYYRNQRKLYFHFRICGGKHDGVELELFCNYSKKKIRKEHKYYQLWSIANGGRPYGNQSMPRRVFKNKKFLVSVRDSQSKYSDGEILPDFLQYSVVSEIKKVIS